MSDTPTTTVPFGSVITEESAPVEPTPDLHTTDPAPDPEPAASISPAAPAAAPERAPASDIEGDLKRVCDNLITGAMTLPEGKSATPHILARFIGELRGGPVPSSGAVAAALDRWVAIGYISMTDHPKAFDDYTDAGRTVGLGELKRQHRARLSEARRAEREAKAAASPARVTEPVAQEPEPAAPAAPEPPF